MKKAILPLILMVVGLAGGYYWGKSGCDTHSFDPLNPSPADKRAFIAYYNANAFKLISSTRYPSSHRIDSLNAKKLIAAFKKECQNAPFPMQNSDGTPLEGYFIDRGPLDKILRNKKWDGVSVCFAKDSTAFTQGDSRPVYTLIYMGGRYNKDSSKVSHVPLKIKSNIKLTGSGDTLTFDFVKPCPTVCNDF